MPPNRMPPSKIAVCVTFITYINIVVMTVVGLLSVILLLLKSYKFVEGKTKSYINNTNAVINVCLAKLLFTDIRYIRRIGTSTNYQLPT